MKNLLKGRPALLLSSLALAAAMPFGSALAAPDYSATVTAILTIEAISGADDVLIVGGSSVTEQAFDDGAIADIIAFPEADSPLGEGDALTLFLSVSGEASEDDEASAVLAALGTLVVDNQGDGPVTVEFSFDYELMAFASLNEATDGSATARASILGIPATGPLEVNADTADMDGGIVADFAFFDLTVDGGSQSSIEFVVGTSGDADPGDGPVVVSEPGVLGVAMTVLTLPVALRRRRFLRSRSRRIES